MKLRAKISHNRVEKRPGLGGEMLLIWFMSPLLFFLHSSTDADQEFMGVSSWLHAMLHASMLHVLYMHMST